MIAFAINRAHWVADLDFDVGPAGQLLLAADLGDWSQPDAQPLTASLQVTLRLESTLLGCFRGQPPDPFWVGPVDAETFRLPDG